MNKVVANLLRFLIVIPLQIFICDRMLMFGFISPALYLLPLFLLPLELPLSIQYLIGFVTGLIMDMFSQTLGINALACTIFMVVRPYLANALNGHRKIEGEDKPAPGHKSFKWILLYVLLLSFLHQTMVILIEAFTFRNFIHTLLNIVGNTGFTVFIIICVEYIFMPAKKKI